ncbi:ArdC family protein [Neisseria sp. Ec49-e6-T10]|uniref:ArdC family protein n=1 Tax=Neisseria sp. Ec49-e6-T10 TaxID=3140744 RepID=UPI003EB86CB3
MNTKESKKNKGQEYAENVANELIKHLQAGTAPWQRPWTPDIGFDLPYNHITGNVYSGTNNLMLMMQMYDDPRWMTYKQAQSVDAQVRKGEKGVGLIRLITHVEKTKRDEQNKPVLDADGNTVKEYAVLPQPIIKSFTVFNGEQIEGIPEYDRKPVQYDWEPSEKAEAILLASKARIDVHPLYHPSYNPDSDMINLPEKGQFPSQEFYYATALHELGHWTGHPSRMDRDLTGKFGSENYAKEELRAEITSLMLSRELGLPHDIGQHAAYVQSWIQVLKDDPMEIVYASKDAQRMKDYIQSFERNQVIQQDILNLKETFHQQSGLLPTKEQQYRQTLESFMDKATLGLSDVAKQQSQLNFYQNQIQEISQGTKQPSLFDVDVDR